MIRKTGDDCGKTTQIYYYKKIIALLRILFGISRELNVPDLAIARALSHQGH
jgi:hypothetical protein